MRILKQLPKPDPAALAAAAGAADGSKNAKKMTLDEIMATLDVDGDGLIDEAEWIAQLDQLPGLKARTRRPTHRAQGFFSLVLLVP